MNFSPLMTAWNKTLVSALLLAFSLAGSSRCAPLFPDVDDPHWARDAVARLAAAGLLEGYPGGVFKGDRAACRWEVALVVARCLGHLEQRQATFADRSELQELHKLAVALKEELGALGVRVTRLEEELGYEDPDGNHVEGRLEKRVIELERITFYGHVSFRGALQNFQNDGSTQSDPNAPLLNMAGAVGSAAASGANFNIGAVGVPFSLGTFGVFPVADLKSGRILTDGVGLTSRAVLGLRMDLDAEQELTAGVEFAAYSSQGATTVDSYYGAQAPYLSNPFTAISTVNGGQAGLTPDNHSPFTRMTLDHFWLRHEPSHSQLRLGAFQNTSFDPLIYVPQINPSGSPDATFYLNSFGVQFKNTKTPITDDVYLSYELMGTRLADGNSGFNGEGYFNHAEGATVGIYFHEDRGWARLNILHAANDVSGGGPRNVGLVSGANQGFVNPWVNPPGFFTGQLAPNQTAGIGSNSDGRPITMPAVNLLTQSGGNDGITGVPGQLNVGNIGPQDLTSYGLSGSYRFDHWLRPRLAVEWAQSVYKPQKNSSYSTSGNALRLELGATIPTCPREGVEEPSSPEQYLGVGLQAEYLSVDPRYDPFILQIPRVAGVLFNLYRFPDLNYSGDLYSLHDTRVYPQNRQGLRLKADWDFSDDGRLSLRYGRLDQKQTSLQDVRFSANSLGVGPNSDVLGHSPGFMEPVFGAFAPQTFAPAGANLLAVPLENPRGRMENFGLDIQHRWRWENDRALTVQGFFDHHRFTRPSNLRALVTGPAGVAGENVNYVDFSYRGFGLSARYDFDDSVGVNVGYDQLHYGGHYDPAGIYSAFAVASGDSRVRNFDLVQHQPHLGLEWKVDPSTTWDFDLRFITNRDLVAANVFPTPGLSSLNVLGSPQGSIHPFNWSGYRINSGMTVKF